MAVDDDPGDGPAGGRAPRHRFAPRPTPPRWRSLARDGRRDRGEPGRAPGHRCSAWHRRARHRRGRAGRRRARCPIVAVTGTNGKTTVTTLVAPCSTPRGAGRGGGQHRHAAARRRDWRRRGGGGRGVVVPVGPQPVVPSGRGGVAELLGRHLDWHADVEDYRAAKAAAVGQRRPRRLGRGQRRGPGGVGRGGAPGPGAPRCGPSGSSAAIHPARRRPGRPRRLVVARVGELPRAMPHDLVDALCAAAAALAAGASPEGCRRALPAFGGLPHRVELVGEANGVRFYDDSKATTPGAVLAAVEGSPAVLIAGGRNKGLDLSVLAAAAPPPAGGGGHRRGRRRGRRGLRGRRPGPASSMAEAVELAAVDGPARGRRGAVPGVRLVRLVRVLRRAGRRLRPVRACPWRTRGAGGAR